MDTAIKIRDNYARSFRKKTMRNLLSAKRRKFMGSGPINRIRTTDLQKLISDFRNLCYNLHMAYKDRNTQTIIDSLHPMVEFLSGEESVVYDLLVVFQESNCFNVMRNILSETHKNNTEMQRMATWVLINLASVNAENCGMFVQEEIVKTLVEMISYSRHVATLQNVFWALTNMVDQNHDIRDEMFQNDFTDHLRELFECNHENFKNLDESFFKVLIALLNKFTAVEPALKFEVYKNFLVCCNNALSSYNYESKDFELLNNALATIRNCSNNATKIEEGQFFRENCINLEQNLIDVIKGKKDPTSCSLAFDIFGNILNLVEEDDTLNDEVMNFILEHLYEEIFYSIESHERQLSESAAFLLCNICILDHDKSEQLAKRGDFINKMIQCIILSADVTTMSYCIKAYSNFLKSMEQSILVEVLIMDSDRYLFTLDRINENMPQECVLYLLDILKICLQCAENHKEVAEVTNFVSENILEGGEEYVEKLEKLQMYDSERVNKMADYIITEYFHCDDVTLDEMREEY